MSSIYRILFVDAHDSFAENIVSLLRRCTRSTVTVIKTDTDIPSAYSQSIESFISIFDAIVLGPGPGDPHDVVDTGLFAIICDLAAENDIPLLGICLGFQFLCLRYGLPVTRLDLPCHGQVKHIRHNNTDIFHDSREVWATNYNSLGVSALFAAESVNHSTRSSFEAVTRDPSFESLRSKDENDHSTVSAPLLGTSELEVLAKDDVGYVMAVRHLKHPFWGIQFHPESCKASLSCKTVLQSWFQLVRGHNKQNQKPSLPPSALSLHVELGSQSGQSSNHKSRLLQFLTTIMSQTLSEIHQRHLPLEMNHHELTKFCYAASEPGSTVMLESTKGGRYSIYAFPDDRSWNIEQTGKRVKVHQAADLLTCQNITLAETLQAIEELLAENLTDNGDISIPFWGGFIGYMSYEPGLDFLDIKFPRKQAVCCEIPDMSLLWVERSIVVDHILNVIHVQSIRKDDRLWIGSTVDHLQNHTKDQTTSQNSHNLKHILSAATIVTPDHDTYISKIKSCQSELHAGNSYELCLTTSARITVPSSPQTAWDLYQNLQHHNPAPFAAFLQINQTTILSSSPEQFLSWTRDGTVDMIPMKGTVKKTSETTLEKAAGFLSSPKETAENLMITDLIRHDLHKSLGPDAMVEVVKLNQVVEHETVYQLVSHIRAYTPHTTINPTSPSQSTYSSPPLPTQTTHPFQPFRNGHRALRTSFPPGSMTGAPKKRSCEILRRLETQDRGIYSGVIGYMDVGGRGSWSVCIRTAWSTSNPRREYHHTSTSHEGSSSGNEVANAQLRHDENTSESTTISINSEQSKETQEEMTWHVGAGGAITVLSDPEAEWDEMVTKLDSVLRAFRSVPN